MRKLLLVSLVLNLALVVAVGVRVKKETSPSITTREGAEVAKTTNALPKSSSENGAQIGKPNATHSKPAFNWRNVESPDYKTYIANLRALHCPESTIADIIIADVIKYYRNKLAPYRKTTDTTFKFWRADSAYYRQDPAFEKLRRDTYKEQNKLLKELLGKGYKEEVAKANEWQMEPNDPFSQGLSQEKKDQMAEVTEKYNELRSDVYAKARGGWQDDDDRLELKRIAQEQTAALAKILTPEELLEYQLRFSEAAQNAKWNELQGFDATEDEFRAIAKSRLVLENADLGPEQKISPQDRSRLMKEADDNLRATLGEERFKEFTLNQNWEYRNLKNIVEKYGGDKQIAPQLYALKDDLQKAVNQVRNDRSLTRDQRDDKLLAIKAEADKTLTDALTARGYKAFKRSSPWIQDIARGLEKR